MVFVLLEELMVMSVMFLVPLLQRMWVQLQAFFQVLWLSLQMMGGSTRRGGLSLGEGELLTGGALIREVLYTGGYPKTPQRSTLHRLISQLYPAQSYCLLADCISSKACACNPSSSLVTEQQFSIHLGISYSCPDPVHFAA